MNLRTIALIAATCGLVLPASADGGEQKSPKGDMIVFGERIENADRKEPDTRKIWLVAASDLKDRRLLFTHYRGADVVFSADESWLAINDHRLSNEACLLLYRRVKGLEYEQVKDLSGEAWNFLWKENHAEHGGGFDHRYVDALQWLEKSPTTLLVTLRGHADSRNYAQDWRCLYDVKTGKFSLTPKLVTHNEGRVTVER